MPSSPMAFMHLCMGDSEICVFHFNSSPDLQAGISTCVVWTATSDSNRDLQFNISQTKPLTLLHCTPTVLPTSVGTTICPVAQVSLTTSLLLFPEPILQQVQRAQASQHISNLTPSYSPSDPSTVPATITPLLDNYNTLQTDLLTFLLARPNHSQSLYRGQREARKIHISLHHLSAEDLAKLTTHHPDIPLPRPRGL